MQRTPPPPQATWPELEAIIGPQGELATYWPAYERRPGQERMMRTVAGTLEKGGTLMVEAATGIGKSLAYLLPAILSGQQTIISTPTIPLQQQLETGPLQLLRDTLNIPFRVENLRGRQHYLCQLQLQRAESLPSVALDHQHPFAAIRTWAQTTPTGLWDTLPGPPPPSALRRQLTIRAEACLGRQCPFYESCFVMQSRRRAEQADLILTNHALFFSDLKLRHRSDIHLLPNADAVIFDEAHHLPKTATLQLGEHLSWPHARQSIARLREDTYDLGLDTPWYAQQWKTLARHLEASFFHLQDTHPNPTASPERSEAWLHIQQCLQTLRPQVEKNPALQQRFEDLAARIQRLLSPDPPTSDHFHWQDPGTPYPTLHAAPTDTAALLQTQLYPRFRSLIFTSGTLTTHGDFTYLRQQLGTPTHAATLRLPSPYPLATQSRLYLATDLPDPRSDTWGPRAHDRLRELLALTDGHALLLFTSHQRLQAAAQSLEGTVPYPLLIQGHTERHALLEAMRQLPHAVLMGTASFWEGIDLPGPALQLVVIDRLPFTPPDDPFHAAQIAAARRRHASPFDTIQIPEATLKLRQGLGRLIRHHDDRGILAILDPRLATMPYGPQILANLGPSPQLRSLDALRSWWAASP